MGNLCTKGFVIHCIGHMFYVIKLPSKLLLFMDLAEFYINCRKLKTCWWSGLYKKCKTKERDRCNLQRDYIKKYCKA
jgi:hypothetical protein